MGHQEGETSADECGQQDPDKRGQGVPDSAGDQNCHLRLAGMIVDSDVFPTWIPGDQLLWFSGIAARRVRQLYMISVIDFSVNCVFVPDHGLIIVRHL